MVNNDDLDVIKKCLTGADTLEEEVTLAMDDFSKGDLKSIMTGVNIMGLLIRRLPEDLSSCP